MRERLRDYEFMFIISPIRSNEEDVRAIVQRIEQTVESAGGEVTSVNHDPPWGRRRLAYPIRAYAGGEASRRNFTEGFYVLMHFSLASQKVVEVERTAKLTDAILRHLVTTVDETRSHALHETDTTDANGQETPGRREPYREGPHRERAEEKSQADETRSKVEPVDHRDRDRDKDRDKDKDNEDEDEDKQKIAYSGDEEYEDEDEDDDDEDDDDEDDDDEDDDDEDDDDEDDDDEDDDDEDDDDEDDDDEDDDDEDDDDEDGDKKHQS